MPIPGDERAISAQRHEPGVVRQPLLRAYCRVGRAWRRAALVDMGRVMNFPSFCHWACGRIAAGPASALHPIVQKVPCQRAARAAPLLSCEQRCAPRARLAAGRSRGRQREAETEGKRKGPARLRPPAQSARGLRTAPRLRRRVQCGSRFATAAGRLRVPFPMHCALMRCRFCHGLR